MGIPLYGENTREERNLILVWEDLHSMASLLTFYDDMEETRINMRFAPSDQKVGSALADLIGKDQKLSQSDKRVLTHYLHAIDQPLCFQTTAKYAEIYTLTHMPPHKNIDFRKGKAIEQSQSLDQVLHSMNQYDTGSISQVIRQERRGILRKKSTVQELTLVLEKYRQ